MKNWVYLAPVAAMLSAAPAGAVTTLVLSDVAPESYQQQTNSPCIISQTPSCNNPSGFGYTAAPHGGNVPTFDEASPDYTVADVKAIAGDNILVGLDIGQAGSQVQTLDFFRMFIDNVLVSEYTGSGTNAPATANPGNGYADLILSNFASLAGYADSSIVSFRAGMSNLNDGPDSFFLIAGDVSEVPIPAALPLLLTGIAGLGFASRRRRAAA